MATFYFNGAEDIANNVSISFETLGNWWMNDTFTIPALSLPTPADDAVLTDGVQISYGSLSITNLTVLNAYIQIGVTVSGIAKFYNGSALETILYGNAEFYDNSNTMMNGGAVTGIARFYDSSYNGFDGGQTRSEFYDYSINTGYAFGPAYFYDFSTNYGDVGNGSDGFFYDSSINNGNCYVNATFYDISMNNGAVYGNATFNNSSTNEFNVLGDATFNDGAQNIGSNAMVAGHATFNGTTVNWYGTAGSATFNDNSYNFSGYVANTATFNDSSIYNPDSVPQIGTIVIGNRTQYPLKRCVNGSNLLGVI